RTYVTCSALAKSSVSTYCPSPVRRRGSSVRTTRLPRILICSSRLCAETQQRRGVVVLDQATLVSGEPGTLEELPWLGKALGMRIVGAEQHTPRTDEIDQPAGVVVVERRDRHVPAEDVARVAVDAPTEPRAVRAGLLRLVHHAYEIVHPRRPVLVAHRLEIGEPVEPVVE